MKKLLSNMILVLLISLNIISPSYSNDHTVKFYTNTDFTGREVIFNGVGCTLQDCTVIPLVRNRGISSILTSKCIQIYARKNCAGPTKTLSTSNGNLNSINFENRAYSFKPCTRMNAPPFKFVSKITEVEITNNVGEILKAAKKAPFDLSNHATLSNNGTQVQEYTISQTRSFREEITVDKTVSSTAQHSFNFDSSFSTKIGVGVPGVASGEIEKSIRLAYGYQNSQSTSDRNVVSTSNDKSFTFQQTVRVGPCQYSEVTFLLNVAENLPIDYSLYMILSGDKCGAPMSASEIRANLPSDYIYDRDESETSVRIKTKGTLRAKVGLNPHLDIKSRIIPNCLGDSK